MIAAGGTVHARGRVRVVHGASRLSRLMTRLLRLPVASEAADVRLTIVRDAGIERWTRTFDGVSIVTTQRELAPGILAEQFGLLEFRFDVQQKAGAVRYAQTGVMLRVGRVRLPLPANLAPRIDGVEREHGPRGFSVEVHVRWPPAGLILAYDGEVQIEDQSA